MTSAVSVAASKQSINPSVKTAPVPDMGAGAFFLAGAVITSTSFISRRSTGAKPDPVHARASVRPAFADQRPHALPLRSAGRFSIRNRDARPRGKRRRRSPHRVPYPSHSRASARQRTIGHRGRGYGSAPRGRNPTAPPPWERVRPPSARSRSSPCSASTASSRRRIVSSSQRSISIFWVWGSNISETRRAIGDEALLRRRPALDDRGTSRIPTITAPSGTSRVTTAFAADPRARTDDDRTQYLRAGSYDGAVHQGGCRLPPRHCPGWCRQVTH